jgi:hypothetical protein
MAVTLSPFGHKTVHVTTTTGSGEGVFDPGTTSFFMGVKWTGRFDRLAGKGEFCRNLNNIN